MTTALTTTLATEINTEHRLATEAAQTAVQHARRCGQLLIEAKAEIGHGGFLAWLAENCQVGERQARTYMRIAENWTAIESKSARGADLTIKGAVRLLSGPVPCLRPDQSQWLNRELRKLERDYCRSFPLTNDDDMGHDFDEGLRRFKARTEPQKPHQPALFE